jgi:hypothetical protein
VSANSSGRTLLGSRLKSARPRFTRRKIAGAAAPAVFGIAAAFAVAAAPAGLSAGSAQAHHPAAAAVTAATSAARPSGHPTARLLSVTQTAAQQYTVQSGDTLSSIAGQFYGNSSDWQVLYWANDSQIQNANEIDVGQVLTVPAQPATIPASPSATTAPAESGPGGTAESSQSASDQATTAAQSSAQQSDGTVSTAGDSSFQACVIQRESGGNPQVMNSSGHYGLYQFSESTWVEYGGNPADFGNATAAEQNQVFDNAIAAGGEDNWAPYDGC